MSNGFRFCILKFLEEHSFHFTKYPNKNSLISCSCSSESLFVKLNARCNGNRTPSIICMSSILVDSDEDKVPTIMQEPEEIEMQKVRQFNISVQGLFVGVSFVSHTNLLRSLTEKGNFALSLPTTGLLGRHPCG